MKWCHDDTDAGDNGEDEDMKTMIHVFLTIVSSGISSQIIQSVHNPIVQYTSLDTSLILTIHSQSPVEQFC